jgi:hypothetical protein
MKVKIVMLVVLSAVAVSIASAQNNQGEVQGGGTPNYITKFTGNQRIGNSALFENGPNLITFDNFAAANVTATVNGPLSIGMTAINNTPDGSTGVDAWVSSGLIGVLAQTQSPASVGIEAQSYATDGDPVAVFGKTVSTFRGIGVRGQAVGATGGGIGVLGEALSSNGFAGLFNQMAANGYPIAVYGYSGSADGGEGVHGQTNAATGLGIGVNGLTSSPDGFGGSFTNFAGGNILRGVNNATVVFRVDGNGTVFADGGLQPGGADFAESMAVSGDRRRYGAGDLLVIDTQGERKLALSQRPYSTLVAGIFSTKPGMLGSTRKADEAGAEDEIPLAVVGIVPCKVSAENGAIRPGDLLVTSSLSGHAMKGTDRSRMMGAVVGKALGSLEQGTGVIQVLVTLQ